MPIGNNTVVAQDWKYIKQDKCRTTKAKFSIFKDKEVWFALEHHQALVKVIFNDKETTMDFIHDMRELLDTLESKVSKH